MKSYISLFLLLHIALWKLNNGHNCGVAGSYANKENQQIQNIGQTVFYHCFNQGVLMGNYMRICQKNRVWNGTIPYCVLPTLNFIRAVHHSSIHNHQRELANVSGCLNDLYIKDPCIILSTADKDWRIRVDFNRPYIIVAVRLILYLTNLYPSIEVKAFGNSTDSIGVPCDHDWRESGVYKCSRPVRAVSLSIGPLSTSKLNPRGINEVYIFEDVTNKTCPTPDRPSYGYFSNGSDHLITRYECHTNYVLIGSDRSVCVNGFWSKPAPICLNSDEICEPFKADRNISGKWVKERNDDGVWRSSLKCDDGFQVFGGPPTIECVIKSQGWTPTIASCKKIIEERLEGRVSNTSGEQEATQPPKTDTKLLIVGTVSGLVSSVFVVSIVLAVMFARKRCVRGETQRAEGNRDSSYYHFYYGINYEEMMSQSSSSCATSRHNSELAPAKDPHVPDILELVYENPSLYDRGNSVGGATVDAQPIGPTGHIYSEVQDGQCPIYDEPERIRISSLVSESSDVFEENEIYGDDECA